MKQKIKLYGLLIITGLLLTLANPAWHGLEIIKSRHISDMDILVIWGEVCLAIGAMVLVICLITPPLSKFFLGYESKKPDEGNEVFFYVVMTAFMLSAVILFLQQQGLPPRNLEKDVKYLCTTLNDNLDFAGTGVMQQKIEAICAVESEKIEPGKN